MGEEVHAGPRRGPIAGWIGRSILRVFGWKQLGEFPNVPRAIFIASPHTSNFDGMLMVSVSYAMRVKLSWLGKKSMFVFPAGYFFRFFGGVPVDRSTSNDTVQQVADECNSRRGMYLAVAPAGTRKKRDYWKSGFYHIALKANVPLICGCIDYGRKEAGIIGVVYPTGNVEEDMEKIREIYEGRMGKFPEMMSRIRLRDEDETKSTSQTS